jgi:HNH endonuclease
MNFQKHAAKVVGNWYCDSGSFVDFSGSIAVLNEHMLKALPLNYNWYMHSEYWQMRREIYMQYYDFVCQRCSKQGLGLSLHHTNYMRLGLENVSGDLMLVCRSCHKIIEDIKRVEMVNKYN